MWEEKEFIDPFDRELHYFWMKIEHFGRYLFACDEIRKKGLQRLRVADIGCANGYGSRLLSDVARTVDGYDINEEYLSVARNKAKVGQEFFKRDFEFPNDAIKFIHESLHENGTLICSVPNHLYEGKNEDGSPSNPFHKCIYKKEEIIEIFEHNGFQVEQIYGQAFPNIFAKNEAKLARKKRLPFTSSHNDLFEKDDVLKYFSYMFAYPNDLLLEKSYSYIYVLRKRI